jgi:DNA-binding transcriptional ArsR family regulator
MSAVATPGFDVLSALRALADPVRLAIVEQLRQEDAWACEVRARLGVSAPLLSHHLGVLRGAGLIRCNRSGRRLRLELRDDVLASVADAFAGREP